jgi:DNA polymerase-1
MSNQKKLILIDGHALAYRMFFALERTGMKTSQKEPTWAVYGFVKAIVDILRKIKPDGIIVSFDMSRKTFRTEEFEDYKAQRAAMPDDLRQISKNGG